MQKKYMTKKRNYYERIKKHYRRPNYEYWKKIKKEEMHPHYILWKTLMEKTFSCLNNNYYLNFIKNNYLNIILYFMFSVVTFPFLLAITFISMKGFNDFYNYSDEIMKNILHVVYTLFKQSLSVFLSFSLLYISTILVSKYNCLEKKVKIFRLCKLILISFTILTFIKLSYDIITNKSYLLNYSWIYSYIYISILLSFMIVLLIKKYVNLKNFEKQNKILTIIISLIALIVSIISSL